MNILIIKSSENARENSDIFKIKDQYVDQVKGLAPGIIVNIVQDESAKLGGYLKNAEIVMASGISDVDLSKAPGLKWIHVTSAGINRLSPELINSDILITNSSGVHPIPVSEHVLAFMLMFARQIDRSFRHQIQKKSWIRDFNDLKVFELAGKTVVIVGLGRIGSKVARLCKAFEMNVIGVVRNLDREKIGVDQLISAKDLDKAIAEADFVVNVLPETEQTRHLFDKSRFKRMKKFYLFINIGRGFTVNQQDLVEALKNGLIAGAGLDVFEVEPLPDSSPLWGLENVIITPHYSGWTPHYMERAIKIFVENLKAYLSGQKMPNLIDKKLGY